MDHNRVVSSPQMMQFRPNMVGVEQPQPSTGTLVRFTSQINSTVPRMMNPTVRPPNMVATSTVNSVIDSTPRMSSTIFTTPGQLQSQTSVP